MKTQPGVCALILLTNLCAVVPAAEPSAATPNVFDLPQIQVKHALLQAKIAALFKQGDYAEGEKHCLAATQLIPHEANGHYNLACAQARQGKTDEALGSLEKAIELGFRGAEHAKADEDLESLRAEDRFKQLLEKMGKAAAKNPSGWQYRVEPAAIEGGIATVDESNTGWDPRLGVFRTFFKLDTAPPATEPIVKGFGDVGSLLSSWQEEGTAAGNRGDLYDNHDSDHSNMKYGMFPQLTRIEFADSARSRRLHHGLQTRFLYNGVTIGNSSTAVTSGFFWRSQARLALTNPRAAALLYVQYRGNHLYVYPEHRDHDPGHNRQDGKGHGDVFPVNTPYLIISQGSSGSDRVFLQAMAATLAALRPEVKTELARRGDLMPTLQMIFRASNKQVAKPEEYLTGIAHPTVFEGSQLNAIKMAKMAHGISKDVLPPLVQLKVVEEDQPRPGRDFFSSAAGERLFDTPCAIARVVRTTNYFRRLVVSAEPSTDFNGKPLTYHWSVLRGDAERIKIQPLNDAGSVVELRIPYHTRRPIRAGSDMQSNRVDIGAFVHNGTYYSAPAFVTFFYLDNERRVYDEKHRIQMVDYADPETSKNYVDPAIDLPKRWRDEYHYDPSGVLTGWTRIRGEAKEEFTADGYLITKTDAEGQPVEARGVRYVVKPRPKQVPLVEQELTDEMVRIE